MSWVLSGELAEHFVEGLGGVVGGARGSGDACLPAGRGMKCGISSPIQNLGGQLRRLAGLDHETRIRFADEPRGFGIRRANKKAWTPGRENPVNFAGNNESAEVRAHGDQVRVGRREALGKLVSGL